MQSDGDPQNNHSFEKTFRSHVRSKIILEETRFTYFLQLCTRDVRQRIEHSSVFENSFELAWHHLYKLYGRRKLLQLSAKIR